MYYNIVILFVVQDRMEFDMINEDKVILMVQLASYEKKENNSMAIGKYFRSDYISVQMLMSFFYATISFLLICGIYVLYDLENFVVDIYEIDLMAYVIELCEYYVGFILIYEAITYLLYWYRYKIARNSLKDYYQKLKILATKYGKK